MSKNRNEGLKDDWATPPFFLDNIRAKYGEYFDPCPWHHDLSLWDGLLIDWHDVNYINPPYSLKLKEAFVKKAIQEAAKGKFCILLLPVSTSTKLFHQYIKPNATKIDWLEGRLPFIGINDKGQKVNYHQMQVVTKETILYEGKEIPMYIRASGQHDSMIVEFGTYSGKIITNPIISKGKLTVGKSQIPVLF